MNPFEQAARFHRVFDPVHQQGPHALDHEESEHRAAFMVEELVEYLAAGRDDEELHQSCLALKEAIDQAEQKVLSKQKTRDDAVVSQSDALIDLLYFTYGTFVKMEVNPMPLYDIVHKANMHKCFPDGKPHYDAITGKVLKPDDWEEKHAPEAKIKQEIERQKKDYCYE